MSRDHGHGASSLDVFEAVALMTPNPLRQTHTHTCMLRLISAVRRLPLALRSLSRWAMASSPAPAGSGLAGALGLAISPSKGEGERCREQNQYAVGSAGK